MKNKISAAMLAFFLGAFGFHKFYLGEIFSGIIYLVFSWTFIPGIVAFFEFLGLLLMSDRAFDARYNAAFLAEKERKLFAQSPQENMKALEKLKNLYDKGIITAEEYEEKRRKILDLL
jgi:TM2 domain-containing membrane protein YozV